MSAVAPKQMHPLLAAYLRNLTTHPLRTKAITTGGCCELIICIAHSEFTPHRSVAPNATW